MTAPLGHDPCEHGMSGDCEMCADEQETLDAQITDDDWLNPNV